MPGENTHQFRHMHMHSLAKVVSLSFVLCVEDVASFTALVNQNFCITKAPRLGKNFHVSCYVHVIHHLLF